MYRLDEDFLAELGLGGLPPEARRSLLQKTYSELEEQVGVRLAADMAEWELAEFELLTDHLETAEPFLDENAPGWRDDPARRGLSPAELQGVAATAWLNLHRPDYRDVVAAVMEEVRATLREMAPEVRQQFGLPREEVALTPEATTEREAPQVT